MGWWTTRMNMRASPPATCAGIIGAWGQLAGSTAAAALEPGPDTAGVLGSGLTELLAYAAR